MYDFRRITWKYSTEKKDDEKPQEEQPKPLEKNDDLEYLEIRIERWENLDD